MCLNNLFKDILLQQWFKWSSSKENLLQNMKHAFFFNLYSLEFVKNVWNNIEPPMIIKSSKEMLLFELNEWHWGQSDLWNWWKYKMEFSISNFKGSFARKNIHKLGLKEDNLVELYK